MIPVSSTVFVVASHAQYKNTRGYHTGFVIFIDCAPVILHSKRKSTVENSNLSSEFIALKICMENILALRFKFRMFGIPILEVTRVLCDNKSAINSSSLLESKLN